jgi:hypothetical protein
MSDEEDDYGPKKKKAAATGPDSEPEPVSGRSRSSEWGSSTTARDLLNELLAELPPKPNSLQVDAFLADTVFVIRTYRGPMEFEERHKLTVDLSEPGSRDKAKAWLEDIIADLIY